MRFISTLLFAQLGSTLLDARRESSKSSCAKIQDVIKESQEAHATSPPIFPVTLAVDCLRSMPYDADLGQSFITELTKYIQFQSTLEALADPPDTYMYEPVDILTGLKNISDTDFDNHYNFDLAISRLIHSAHDNHLSVQLCSQQIFNFVLPVVGFVSVSDDGYESPAVYLTEELNSGQNTSSVSKINGEDAEDFLDRFAAQLENQDPDANWNRLFNSLAVAASGDPLSGSGRLTFHGDLWWGAESLDIEFRNGSRQEIPFGAQIKIAAYKSGFASSGDELFEMFCLPEVGSTTGGGNGSSAPDPTEPSKQGPNGYPEPTFRDSYNQILGFELDNDTMVMYIPTFADVRGVANSSMLFADTAGDIVNSATKTGRSKIIIDISANGGGNIVRGFDLFKLFFPDGFPYSETRFRRSEASESLAQIGEFINRSESYMLADPLFYRNQVSPDQKNDFESLGDFLGNENQLGVNVSSPFANFNYTYVSTERQPIRGYGEVIDLLNKTQPFKAEDILIVGDGNCVSTCTTFVNLMTNVGGVRSLAFGGRPRKEPMQIMGGVRGAQAASFEALIDNMIETANATLQDLDENELPSDFMEIAQKTWPVGVANLPLQLSQGNVNLRNAYQEGNSDIPLQFEYQAADCRLYFTVENVLEPATAWVAAKEAIWGSAGCVQGSTGGKGSLKDRESSQDKKEGGAKETGDADSAGSIARSQSGSLLALMVLALAVVY
ncbi:hypothetical protein NW752_007000 [Fusarium irregulare]|uniref:CPAF-like PDZ domain-containing protein n=1 Tax=Fusarium irregulare TaxID=2494466 RepID=A0A9W8UB98_9HYPO|nr:hypothetical protein NW766_005885 [Fusarium irregulare]KAJ4016064.1 hypothetical protein NW752_007000 [Fusarium irregulare]